ncbi:hypothetical protein FACS1894211_05520 [Clostridia bacterium]|nr:hypothetical protein FACS1894211_05520 [Clostridia bacterium]
MIARKFFAALFAVLFFASALFACGTRVNAPLPVPAGLKADNIARVLSWEAVPDASGYSVEIDGTDYGAADNTYSPLFLANDRTYSVRVKAVGGKSGKKTYADSDWSEKIAYTPETPDPEPAALPKPTGLYVYDNIKQLQWTLDGRAAGYTVRAVKGAGEPISYNGEPILFDDAAMPFTLAPALEPGVYKLSVGAKGDGGRWLDSPWSDEVGFTYVVQLPTPDFFQVNEYENTIEWGYQNEADRALAAHAVGYTVEIMYEGSLVVPPYEPTEPSCTLAACTVYQRTYTIRIRARGDGKGYDSSPWVETAHTVAANRPTPVELLVFNGVLRWRADDYATGYAIEIRAESTDDGDTADFSATAPPVPQGASYAAYDLSAFSLPRGAYRITVQTLCASSPWSDSLKSRPYTYTKTEKLSAPSSPAFSGEPSNRVLSWTAVPYANGYTVEARGTSPSSVAFFQTFTVTDAFFAFAEHGLGADAPGIYSIRLYARGDVGAFYEDSDWTDSPTYKVTAKLSAPAGVTLDNDNVLSWNPVSRATGYRIGLSESGGPPFAATVNVGAATVSYRLSGAELGLPQGYSYRVRVMALGDLPDTNLPVPDEFCVFLDSDWSDGTAAALVVPVQIVWGTGVLSLTSYELTWPAPDHAAGYVLYVKDLTADAFLKINNLPLDGESAAARLSDNRYLFSPTLLPPGRYEIKVRALGDKADGGPHDDSEWLVLAPEDSVICVNLPPVEALDVSVSAGSATLRWKPVEHAAGYKIRLFQGLVSFEWSIPGSLPAGVSVSGSYLTADASAVTLIPAAPNGFWASFDLTPYLPSGTDYTVTITALGDYKADGTGGFYRDAAAASAPSDPFTV